jgi:thiol-disulfide isomerase/thioredoxin
MKPLGTPMPAFRLPDAVTGADLDSASLAGAPVLVMFVCNHCPYVVHVRGAFGPLAADYGPKGLQVVAINSNSMATHPEDGPEAMKALALELGWPFPFCFDATQEVARAFDAACTPDFFLYDASGALAYRGQLDGARPGNGEPVTGASLRAAIEAVLAGEAPSPDQVPSMGCNIKWVPEG